MSIKRIGSIFFLALTIKAAFIFIAYVLPFSILNLIGWKVSDHGTLINYAPEVWLSLLALVFGTLIIVVSIASENTPKLIDLFIGDPIGRLYIWLIMLSSLENIYLQLFGIASTTLVANLIFINSYVLLPCFVMLAIPYAFYILKNTKNDNVIRRIYKENIRALIASKDDTKVDTNRLILFETINQLHDLLQYIQFKEPKGDIINRMGKSLRLYIELKRTFPDSYFELSDLIKSDISFRTLGEKLAQMETKRTFYEHKVLKVLGTTYLLLIRDSHYELASLCGVELFETGKTATIHHDDFVIDCVVVHFNTFLRYGINHGLRTREIRNVYNTLFHYSHFAHLFVEIREHNRILQCCQYFLFYTNEVARLSLSEPLFIFLIEAFAWELKKILIALNRNGFPREFQKTVLKLFTNLRLAEKQKIPNWRHINYNGVRLIQIGLCLYYLSKDESEYNEIMTDSIVSDLSELSRGDAQELLTRDCNLLEEEIEEFWEETDQGNRNIFYSPDKTQIPKFSAYIASKVGELDTPDFQMK